MIFVGGPMHSGTSLLAQVLRGSPNVDGPEGETKFFEFLPVFTRLYPDLYDTETLARYVGLCQQLLRGEFHVGLVKKLADPADPIPDCVLNTDRTHSAVFLALSSDWISDGEATRFLEKTPSNVYAIPAIRSAVPDAFLAIIVRDPRDYLASKKLRVDKLAGRFTGQELERKRNEKAYDPVLDTISWRAAVRCAAAALRRDPERTVVVTYEDLVTWPERVGRALASRMGLTYAATMTDLTFNNAADRRPRSGIDQRSVGSFLDLLTDREIQVTETLARSAMDWLGYRRVGGEGAASWIATAVASGPASMDLADRIRRRTQLGGVALAREQVRGYRNRLGAP